MFTIETSVVLADDHPLVLRGLVDLFLTQPDISVVGTAADGRAAVELILEKKPTVAVLDLVMPHLSGLEVLRQLTLAGSPSKVVFLSALITEQESIEAIGGGAWGILLKESAPEALIECLRSVCSGNRWLPSNLFGSGSAPPRNGLSTQLFGTLTTRECEIVNLVSEGLSNKKIALLLGLTEGTVKIHLHNVYSKLEIANRTALASRVITLRR